MPDSIVETHIDHAQVIRYTFIGIKELLTVVVASACDDIVFVVTCGRYCGVIVDCAWW